MKKYIKNKWVHYITNVALTGTVFVLMFTGAEYLFYRAMPMDYWLEYHNVKPTATIFLSREKPIFESHYTLNNKVHVHYLDILRCNPSEIIPLNKTGFNRVSQYVSEAYLVQTGDQKPIWVYQAETSNGLCYLESNIKLELPYGITKHQKIIGENFIIQ